MRFFAVVPALAVFQALAVLLAMPMARPAQAASAGPAHADTAHADTAHADTARADPARSDPARLCAENFDGAAGTFDTAQIAAWCRRGAELADGKSLEAMGLLALAGVGMPKDFDAAGSFCTRAAAQDPSVAAGFCHAAVAREQRRAGTPVTTTSGAAPDPDPAIAADIATWRDRADRGDHAASASLCGIYFSARDGAFDPAATAAWCRRAAGYGDARAMRRLGLMHLWGVGTEKSAPQAAALCDEAQARDRAVSAGFCVAAVTAGRSLATSDAAPMQSAYPAPWPGASDLGKLPTALVPDRVLETMRSTATGLRYNCRELIKWSRYGLSVDQNEFGRPVLQYRDADYAGLDAAAAGCSAEIAPYDGDGSERQHLAEFQKMMPMLRQRQRQLNQAAQMTAAERQQSARNATDRNKGFSIMEAFLSATQLQCIEAIHRDWLSRDFSPGSHLMEIRTAATSNVNGDTIVSGRARVSDNTLDNSTVDKIYSCTFAGRSPTIVAKTLMPAASPSLPRPPANGSDTASQ